MDKLVSAILVGIVFMSGCVQQSDRIINRNVTHITYSWKGENFTGIFYSTLGPAMLWIEDNTFDDEKFLTWWDYGHTVRGIGGRETLVWEPSRDILYTVSKYTAMTDEERAGIECDCSPHYKIADLVGAFTTQDSSWLAEVMYKYEFDYVLVTEEDISKSYSMLMIAGKDPMAHLTGDFKPTELGERLVIVKLVVGENLPGFELVYSDRFSKIYRYMKEEGR